MRILLVHSGKIPVFAYGGTERVVWDLARALVQLGHHVDFCVPSPSHCDFARIHTLPKSRVIDPALARQYDMVHYHFKPRQTPEFPYVMTEHGNAASGDRYPHNTVFLSANHAQRNGASCYVYNGLDWSSYGPSDAPLLPMSARSYCHFLAKAAWAVKNVRGAISVARAAHLPLHVLGGYRLQIKRGFRYTAGRDIRFYGMVGGQVKFQALQASAGLILPVIWHEPYGLAIIESLYFGAPVFATPYGALPELVPADCGVLSSDGHVLAQALAQQRLEFDPRACRAQALRFHAKEMAAQYVRVYERVLAGEQLNAQTPVMQDYPKHLPFIFPEPTLQA